ncbi:uncharacterized protein I303_104545 [Kwoniella dejecticola CBS 10117]|uniref:Uncharacterized protein n=1 Tax=Kwoniella dejecticola CBS 10117 TaxID=1296121 RepID=A0A1A6A500_9TREE|nr:uncharacterized protein I303_04477 [Kwoniella dejecticola CBS 10117]OBR85145.1 hypothetical protein I303_04477 [Kwoniella dejecticola CBS 10117]
MKLKLRPKRIVRLFEDDLSDAPPVTASFDLSFEVEYPTGMKLVAFHAVPLSDWTWHNPKKSCRRKNKSLYCPLQKPIVTDQCEHANTQSSSTPLIPSSTTVADAGAAAGDAAE